MSREVRPASGCGRLDGRLCVLAALVAIVTVGCAAPGPAGSDPARVCAVIDGDPVPEAEFERFVAAKRGQLEEVEVDRSTRFREFVSEYLLLREAEKAGIVIEKPEVEKELYQWLSSEQPIDDSLRDRARDLLKIQKFLRQQIALQVDIDLKEMQVYYQKHAREFVVNDQAHVLEILVDEAEQAEAIRGRIEAGDVRAFKDAARQHSRGLMASNGGDLGTFERGELPENFEKFIFALRPGEVSPVFQSAEGYHLFMVEEWVPRHAQKFYEVQDVIFETLLAERERAAVNHYMRELLQSASIEIHDETLRFDWEDSDGR